MSPPVTTVTGMKRIALAAVLVLAACAGDDDTIPAPALDYGNKTVIADLPSFREFEIQGPNLYFFCDGTVGVYVTEGSNNDSGKSASPAAVPNHPMCAG